MRRVEGYFDSSLQLWCSYLVSMPCVRIVIRCGCQNEREKLKIVTEVNLHSGFAFL